MIESLILASGSPRRKELLTELVSRFEVVVPRVAELRAHEDGPSRLAFANAQAKTRSVARSFPQRWVLGADTVVALGRETFAKPKDMKEASKMLETLSGRTHQVFTGICLKNCAEKVEKTEVVESKVTFRRLDPELVKNYLELANPLDKAGGYAIQTKREWIVEALHGSLSNVIGLPVERLREWFIDVRLIEANG